MKSSNWLPVTSIIIYLILVLVSPGQGLECFVCQSSDVSFDPHCENGNRTGMASVTCPESMMYCTYTKSKWSTISGADSVLRSCALEPMYKNGEHILLEGNLTVWYKSCGFDFCNSASKMTNTSYGLVVLLFFRWLSSYLSSTR